MRWSWLSLALPLGMVIGCSDKDDSSSGTDSDSGDSADTADTSSDTDSGDDTDPCGDESDFGAECPTGPGFVSGILLDENNVALTSGKVRLFDCTGSDEKVYSNVGTDGSFQVVYGRGYYVMRGEYSTCLSEDIAVTLCGDQTVYQNITVDTTACP